MRYNKNKYNRYGSIQDIINGEYNKDEIDHYPELCGLQIRKPHFLKMDGFKRGHHDVIVFRGEYRYDNIVIGTNGSSKQSYIKSGSKMKPVVGLFLPLKTKGGEETDFIVRRIRGECHLYHIPSETLSSVKFRYGNIQKTSVKGVFNINGEDRQIEWTGSQFIEHDKADTNEPGSSTEVVEVDGEEHISQNMDMRSAHKYPLLLDRLNRRISIINDKQDAKDFLNSELNKQRIDIKERKINHIKQKYAEGKISIKEFEQEIKSEIKHTLWIEPAEGDLEELDENVEDIDMDSNESDEIYDQEMAENSYI